MEKLRFCSLSSGSSGNCYYLGSGEKGILVDAGISARAITRHLQSIGTSLKNVMGIFVTHNHHDHVAGLRTLTKKYHIPVFSTEKVWHNILKVKSQTNLSRDCIRIIRHEQPFDLIGVSIEAFKVSHDTPEALGYYIQHKDRKITIVTDLGHICTRAAKYIKAANFLVIESNYDKDMLFTGKYPHSLKNRIHGNNGHLNNEVTASFLAENMNDELTHICLAHLSKDNNTPEVALLTMQTIFYEKNLLQDNKPKICVLNRNVPSEVFDL